MSDTNSIGPDSMFMNIPNFMTIENKQYAYLHVFIFVILGPVQTTQITWQGSECTKIHRTVQVHVHRQIGSAF